MLQGCTGKGQSLSKLLLFHDTTRLFICSFASQLTWNTAYRNPFASFSPGSEDRDGSREWQCVSMFLIVLRTEAKLSEKGLNKTAHKHVTRVHNYSIKQHVYSRPCSLGLIRYSASHSVPRSRKSWSQTPPFAKPRIAIEYKKWFAFS